MKNKTENQILQDKMKKDLSSSIKIGSYVFVKWIRDVFKVTDKNYDTFELYLHSPLTNITIWRHPNDCSKITKAQADNYLKNIKKQ